MRAAPLTLAAMVLLLLGAQSARAQNTTFVVTGLPATFATPTGADFAALPAGSITYPTPTTYTVTGNAWNRNQTRTETIRVMCVAPCPASGPKAMATLQWRRSDLGVWNTITTAAATVEQVVLNAGNGGAPRNPTYSNSIVWRFLLNWTTDPPGAQTTFNVRVTLTQTT
jgi:hypothetical protein